VLGQHPDIRLTYVFGSVAAGTEHSDSDVDLAVLCAAALIDDQQTAYFGYRRSDGLCRESSIWQRLARNY